MRMAAFVLAWSGLAFAEPVTYDLVAETGFNGGTPTGFITWESANVASNADLTLANATGWRFALGQIHWEKGGADISRDSPSLAGVFGVDDLLPAAGHDYSVGDPPPTDFGFLLRPTEWFLTSPITVLPIPDGGSGWKLVLRSTDAQPVPEPGTFVLSGLAVAGAVVWGRRRRAMSR